MMGLCLITGGAASGKSEYAENMAVSMTMQDNETHKLFYIASMYPYDEESRDRIKRHRMMREGREFETVECYTGVSSLNDRVTDDSVVLFECMSNLLANEIYLKDGALKSEDEEELQKSIDECIIKPFVSLSARTCLLIITNDVFADGNVYDHETERYIRLLDHVNRQLAKHADHVIRVVCSIPVSVK